MAKASPEVKCTVDSCKYWGTGNICHADKIHIAGEHATTSAATDCDTFVMKSDYQTTM